MSKRTHVTGTYRIDDAEALQFSVTFAADAYPDVLSEAKASVLAMLHDGLADVLAQTRPAETETK